jgi:NTE family protein
MVLDEVSTGRVYVGVTGQGAIRHPQAASRRIEAPYLQLVMTRLWEAERQRGSNVLQAETLSRLGHAQQIVQNHLDGVMSRFSEEQQDIAARAFQLLVTPSGTKIAYSVRDLAEIAQVDSGELRLILDSLSAGSDRILRPVPSLPDQPDDERFEIFHDRLGPAVLDWRARRARSAVAAPVSRAATAEEPEASRGLDSGIALSLSGGGYRAMLFHAGALWRLNELGFLLRLACIASVSVSSFLAALLGRAWRTLEFGPSGTALNFVDAVMQPVRRLAGQTLDRPSVIRGLLTLGNAGDALASYLAAPDLLGDATLQDLPEQPRFIMVATNLQTGAIWRFQRAYLGDYQVGRVVHPTLPLATAAAASAAVPPILSPYRIRFAPGSFEASSYGSAVDEALRREVFLADGSVVDKIAIETTWKRYRTIFVSDATGAFSTQPEPDTDWARQSIRVLEVIDNQLVGLRRRQIVEAFTAGERLGTYWSIRTAITDYGLSDTLPASPEQTTELATIPSRMAGLDGTIQERLVNWGYAVSDAALRRHVDPSLPPPTALPYPASGI